MAETRILINAIETKKSLYSGQSEYFLISIFNRMQKTTRAKIARRTERGRNKSIEATMQNQRIVVQNIRFGTRVGPQKLERRS